jgi:hypothetical protein
MSKRSARPPIKPPVRKLTTKRHTQEITESLQTYEKMVGLISNLSTHGAHKEASLSVVGELQASPRTLEQAASEQTEMFFSLTQSILKEVMGLKARVAKVEEELDTLGV